MKTTPFYLRGSLLLFTACTMASTVALHTARAQSTGVAVPGEGSVASSSYQVETIRVLAKKLIIKEKDLPSAVYHVTPEEIAAEGELGSVQSVLKNTPSVNEYQSGPGQGVPVLTIRGVRLYELTETLDGNPMTDILYGGQGGFLTNNIGSPVTLDQLSDTTVFPGVAPPDDQGFGSGGGTIAYTTINPSNTKSEQVFAGYGSFDTSHAGFQIDTGKLGTGDDAPKALLRYDQGYTNGFDDNTNERYGDMIFKIDKPYDDGLSNLSLSVIYNRAFGYLNTAPLPIPLIQQYGYKYNFPKSLTFTSERNQFLTANLADETFVNPNLKLYFNLFYNRSTYQFLSYQNPNSIAYSPSFPYQITFQVPYFATGAIGPTAQALGVATVANPTIGGYLKYDPLIFYPGGAPAAIADGDANTTVGYSYGESAELSNGTTNTIGFTPHASIFLPYNTIKVGGLIAKENGQGNQFIYGNPDVPQEPGYNETTLGGGAQRTVYQVYAQDTIDLLNNHLHINPAVTVAAAYTSVIDNESFNYPAYKLENFDSIAEPYLGVSYDLPDHFTVYADYGKGGYFAPISDYAPTELTPGVITLTAPKPEIVHLYEAGLRYDSDLIGANLDAYYQKITSADSFFVNYATGAADDGNSGAQQFRGYEFQSKLQVTPDFSISDSASYTDARYLSSYFALDTPFEDQYGYVFKGDPLASIPNWLANLGFDYKWNGFAIHFNEQYTGSQFSTYDFQPSITSTLPNITSNPGCSFGSPIGNACLGLATVPDSKNQANIKTAIGGPIPELQQPNFFLTNVLLTYDLPLKNMPIQKLHFELNIQNLLGAHILDHLYSSYAEIPDGHGGYAITAEYNSAFYGPPRSITLEVSAKF
jgi:iron complex outermembrane receptor protein